MKYCYLLCIISFLAACKVPSVFEETVPKDQFPQDWEGIWEGDLEIYSGGQYKQTVPMELHILPIDSTNTHSWTIIYVVEEQAEPRPYELVTKDSETGHYQIDEHNSIVLDDYLFGNTLFSRFEVGGTLLLARTEHRGDHLLYEIIAGPMEAIATTGDEIVDGEEIPAVGSYKVNVMQRAVLSLKE